MQTIAIIAGNKQESDQWIRNHWNLCNRYVYIVDKNTPLWWLFDSIEYVWTCKERSDWLDLQKIVKDWIMPQIKERKAYFRQLKKLAKK